MYAPQNRRTPRDLDEHDMIEADVDSKATEVVDPKAPRGLPKAPEWLKDTKPVPRR